MSARTTLPRKPSGVNGGEWSHDVAPLRDGKLPSIGSRAGAGVIGNTSLGIGAGTPAGAPTAAARLAAIEIRWTLLMSPPISSLLRSYVHVSRGSSSKSRVSVGITIQHA